MNKSQKCICSIASIILSFGVVTAKPTKAATIKADFFANLNQVDGNLPPGIGVGTPVSGTILYQTRPNGTDQIPLDFTLSIGSNYFTFGDLTQIRILNFEGTGGFDTQATLKPREGLGDWSQGISFEIFQEYEQSNLYLSSGFSSAFSYGELGLYRQEVTPVPEPDMLAATAVAGAIGWWLRRNRKVSC